MAVKKAIENKQVVLYNKSSSGIGFKPFGMSNFIDIPPCSDTKFGYPIEAGLLKNTLLNERGVRTFFSEGSLVIEDDEVNLFLGFNTTKNPLIKEYAEIIELLKGDEDELESFLDMIMDDANNESCKAMPELVVKCAIDIKLNNLDKIKMIEDYTGKLLGEVLEELRSSEPVKTTKGKTSNKKGKVFEE